MKRTAGYAIIGLILTGCSVIPFRDFDPFAAGDFRNKLESAASALNKGKKDEAATILNEICAHSSMSGVTDEALFRLALLQLSDEEEDTGHAAARQLLGRLKKEFPGSQWTILSQPVLELLDEIEDLQNETQNLRANNSRSKEYRELKNIKGLNQSLIKQNRDLQQTIDRLKAIDLELERKSR